MPDISGFTRFVNQMEIEHSRLIIQELLETMINTNQIGLEVSEIEGDAILFYKVGDPPDFKTLYEQVEKMFCAFHRQLISYDHRRFCQCDACTSAIDLTLKVITHYGEFTTFNVKNFNKLFGKDIIVAHQLLKNDIEKHEYWLVTRSLLQTKPPANLPNWMEWISHSKQTDEGEIAFQYAQLSPLINDIAPDPLPPLELLKKVKMMTFSREYESDIIPVFHATGNFNYRSRWEEGVKAVEEVSHFLPRLGMKVRFVFENGEDVVYASSYSFHPERIEFSETEDREGTTVYYILEKVGDKRTRLTLSYYIRKKPLARLLFNLTRRKRLETKFQRSLANLEQVVKEIKLPGAAVA